MNATLPTQLGPHNKDQQKFQVSVLLLPQRQRVQQPPAHPEARGRHQRRHRQPLEPLLAARLHRHRQGEVETTSRGPNLVGEIQPELCRIREEETLEQDYSDRAARQHDIKVTKDLRLWDPIT